MLSSSEHFLEEPIALVSPQVRQFIGRSGHIRHVMFPHLEQGNIEIDILMKRVNDFLLRFQSLLLNYKGRKCA
jgi:hypothetical protein